MALAIPLVRCGASPRGRVRPYTRGTSTRSLTTGSVSRNENRLIFDSGDWILVGLGWGSLRLPQPAQGQSYFCAFN